MPHSRVLLQARKRRRAAPLASRRRAPRRGSAEARALLSSWTSAFFASQGRESVSRQRSCKEKQPSNCSNNPNASTMVAGLWIKANLDDLEPHQHYNTCTAIERTFVGCVVQSEPGCRQLPQAAPSSPLACSLCSAQLRENLERGFMWK